MFRLKVGDSSGFSSAGNSLFASPFSHPERSAGSRIWDVSQNRCDVIHSCEVPRRLRGSGMTARVCPATSVAKGPLQLEKGSQTVQEGGLVFALFSLVLPVGSRLF